MGIDAGDPAHPDCIAVPGADPANDLTPMATIRWQALGRQSDERGALSVVDFGGLRFASVDAPIRARGAAGR